MDPEIVRVERRGRKRKRRYGKNAPNSQEPGSKHKRRTIEIRGVALLGRYVLKEFEGEGVYLGKVIQYDSGLYRVNYEDGDCEDLDSGEVRQYLIGDEYFDDDLTERRGKLDEFVEENKLKYSHSANGNVGPANSVDNRDDAERVSGKADNSELEDDDTLSENSCESDHDLDLQPVNEGPNVPPPDLPPSCGNIGLPEELVPYLFSVYGFLRSFSIRLFLSPFTLDDLVGCLNCHVPNHLLDAIHVSLLQMVRQHLENMSSEGSELASKCLKCIDWSLLDLLTWPVYLVHYLMAMKRLNEDEWNGFYIDALEKEYCTLPVGKKLIVLQILCDDALDSAEIRAELDMREESELGSDLEETCESRPPRFFENSAGEGRERRNTGRKDSNHSMSIDDSNEDGNSDECRLCGMDGTLLCCDGCPSAYHSRCIGISKTFIPEGPWFCPECTISKIGPVVTMKTSLKGAEFFGSDPYGFVFFGTCNYLVVLKVSVDRIPFARYYSQNDIPTVLRALNSFADHAAIYAEMCQAILTYWGLSAEVAPLPWKCEESTDLIDHEKEEAQVSGQSFPHNRNGNLQDMNQESNVYSLVGVGAKDLSSTSGLNETLLDGLTKQTNLDRLPSNHSVSVGCSSPNVNDELLGKAASNRTMFTPAVNQQNDLSRLSHLRSVGSSIIKKYDTSSAGHSNCNSGGSKNGVTLRFKLSSNETEGFGMTGIKDRLKDCSLYTGSSFRPHAYINQYVQGNFAASAAANLTLLSSEEKVSEISDPRKAMAAKVSLQVKAFSSVAIRFFWPSTEKKLVEVPRERCGWCLSCKSPVSSKKACSLNAAALNATRAAMKSISGLRLTKNPDASLYGIVMYTLYLEESLRGLVVGPFRSASYRQRWCRQVEMSSSCSEIKPLLLLLETNMRAVAHTSDWFKLVENWVDDFMIGETTCPLSSTQKRPGRRGRKPLSICETTTDDSRELSNEFSWWRGGKLSKLVFQKGILPRATLKKAAQKGGVRKIDGIYYSEGSDIPKRSRQFLWRASVEMSKNASHLALQVRYLDHHIRWGDLVRPEQNPQEGKGPETEASAFRNAFICDKKFAENKVMYAVVFGHQKHLPSRLMKSIVEKDEIEDGKERYWFLENRVPLYMVKGYEEQAENATSLPSSRSLDNLSKVQKQQLKAYRKDVFAYLERNKNHMGRGCFCASCHLEALLTDTVSCSACEGFCHKECTISTTVKASEDVKVIITCRSCFHARTLPLMNKSVESPTSPLALLGLEYQNGTLSAKTPLATAAVKNAPLAARVVNSPHLSFSVSRNTPLATPVTENGPKSFPVAKNAALATPVEKNAKQKSRKRLPSLGTQCSSDMKPPTTDSSSKSKTRKRSNTWGLIMRKKNTDGSGEEFKLKNILTKGGSNYSGIEVRCRLCHKDYNPDMMYIFCETCQGWYHADAVELDEKKLPDLLGFKCCKCRRIKSPECPYDDKTKSQKKTLSTLEGGVELESPSESFSEKIESPIPSTPISPMEDDVLITLDDPLLISASEVEEIPEPKQEVDTDWSSLSGVGKQKLPIRRHLKQEKDAEGFAGINLSSHEVTPSYSGLNYQSDPTHNMLLSHAAKCDASDIGVDDVASFEYDDLKFEDADYEPQTYFSFTELLASDDAGQAEGINDAPGSIQQGDWEHWEAEGSQYGYIDQNETGLLNNVHWEPMASNDPVLDVPCHICSHVDPAPDLSCSNCRIQIHSHCSPWEEVTQEESWKCGSCRAWR